MAEITFPSSYLTEKLKLGDVGTARAIKKQLGLEELTARDVGLSLSFSEDRALTAVQSLFAFQGFRPQEIVLLTPQAQEQWGCAEVPVMITEVKAYCRAYIQAGDVTSDAALTALKSLADKHFYLSPIPMALRARYGACTPRCWPSKSTSSKGCAVQRICALL